LPTTRHSCNLDVWALEQSCGDRHRSLVSPKRVLSEYNEDLIFYILTCISSLVWALLSYRIDLYEHYYPIRIIVRKVS